MCLSQRDKRKNRSSNIGHQRTQSRPQVSQKRSSTINSLCFGEYQAMALAEPRTCNAYSKANVGSSTPNKPHPALFKSIVTPESALKLTGPAICNQCFKKPLQTHIMLHSSEPVGLYKVVQKDFLGKIAYTGCGSTKIYEINLQCKQKEYNTLLVLENFPIFYLLAPISIKTCLTFSYQTSPKQRKSSTKCLELKLWITGSTQEIIAQRISKIHMNQNFPDPKVEKKQLMKQIFFSFYYY